jgi:hypothetical protein
MIDLIQACEADLRAGKISQAAARLRAVKTDSIPREHRMTVANLCRRAQMDHQAMKILGPVVRPEKLITAAASPEEQAEYAACLLKIGAAPEALAILEGVQDIVPAAKLFKAFCHFKSWEHSQAIPLLRDFIGKAPSEYLKFVGQVNLAAAYAITLRPQMATEALRDVMAYAQHEGHKRLWANAHEIRAQVHISEGRYNDAKHDLTIASAELKEVHDELLIRKWTAIAQSLQTGSVAPLDQFREEAISHRDRETLRDVDYFRCRLQFEEGTFSHLIFGTPFGEYRTRMMTGLGRHPIAHEFIWGLALAPRFYLATGEVEGMKASSPGNTVHQLLAVLLSDLYRPWSIGSIFAALFPREYFDVFSSPNRVHQLLWRLRRWFEANDIPVELGEYNGQYRLDLKGEFAFVLPLQKVTLDEPEIYLRKIQSLFGRNGTFSSRDVQTKLGISSSSFKRLASWALENKRIVRMGASRATVYRVVA